MRGDRDGGLDGVRITAEEGRRARWGGLWTWALLMQREEREDEALAAIRRLNARFPKNPDFVLDEVSILTALGDFEAARELAERVLERREAGFGNYRLALPGLAEARLGEALLFAERWEEAEAVFSRGLEAGPNPEVRAILLFRRGNARDGAGKRGTALTDYGRVVRDDADPGARRVGGGAAPGALAGRGPGGVPPRPVARTAWNAGFSRHALGAAQRNRVPPLTQGGAYGLERRLQPAQPAGGGRRDGAHSTGWFGCARRCSWGSNKPPAALRAAVPAEAGVPSRRCHPDVQHCASAALRAAVPAEAGPVLPVGAPSRRRHHGCSPTRDAPTVGAVVPIIARMSLRRTPLHALHKELGGRLVPFAGWEMPVQFGGWSRSTSRCGNRRGSST